MVHLGVATLEGRVLRDKEQEVKIAVDVKKGKLMVFDEWGCEWERKTEGGRQRDRVSYSLLGWTWHVSTPARLSRSPLQPNIPSTR